MEGPLLGLLRLVLRGLADESEPRNAATEILLDDEFDRGVGEVFVVRVAGNIAGPVTYVIDEAVAEPTVTATVTPPETTAS